MSGGRETSETGGGEGEIRVKGNLRKVDFGLCFRILMGMRMGKCFMFEKGGR